MIWMHLGGHDVSVRDAMLTVSPKMQKRRRILPTMPDTAGPLWMPKRESGGGRGNKFGDAWNNVAGFHSTRLQAEPAKWWPTLKGLFISTGR